MVVWNKTKKRNKWGQVQQRARPEAEHLRAEAPHLRIVENELWMAVRRGLDDARTKYLRGTKGQLWGRPTQGSEPKYLLTGLIRCAECGGSVYVRSRASGRRRRFLYGCTSYHLRGRVVCANGYEVPMEATNALVLDAFKADILRPDLVDRAIDRVVDVLTPADRDAELCRLKARLVSLQ